MKSKIKTSECTGFFIKVGSEAVIDLNKIDYVYFKSNAEVVDIYFTGRSNAIEVTKKTYNRDILPFLNIVKKMNTKQKGNNVGNFVCLEDGCLDISLIWYACRDDYKDQNGKIIEQTRLYIKGTKTTIIVSPVAFEKHILPYLNVVHSIEKD